MPHASFLQPCGDLAGLRPADLAGRVFLPALAPFAVESWPLVALLPVLDINGALGAALAGRRPFRGGAPVAGIFACDPFLRLSDLAATLRDAGITQVVNYPTVQIFEGETAAALAAVSYRAEAEFRLLLRLAGLGFSPVACATSRAAVDVALGLGLRRILLHPGVIAPADAAGWWAPLATRVAVEGGEALAWRAPDQASIRRRRMRL